MHLKSLTLKGFKSFAQSTTFQFEPGVTAIVGPNGSGKSNVVDALAWVMGEQGAKTLRGGKMEDVIFAGTSTRGPLGRAEVRLTIDNSDGALPIEYAEVTISRTLFRNGSSEYAINGESCRLLDVQELLSDSGLGREMHVIVGQGQLDAVLRATPDDRRGFIEEAAGILKHRRRKERTVRKLEAMETNLTRLNDLAGEIRRQLKPLGRQAEVARAAQGIAAEVRDAKARLLADDVFRLRSELSELSKDEAERHSERIVLQEQAEQKQLRIERIEQEQQSDDLDAARRVVIGLESAQSKLRGLYAQAQQRLTFLATQADAPEQANRVSRALVEEAAEEAKLLDALIPKAEEAWREAGVATRTAQAALDALDEHITAQSALVSKHDLQLSQLQGRVETSEQKLHTVKQEVQRREHALAQADERLLSARQELEGFEERVGGADSPREGNLDDAYRAAQDQQSEIERLRDELRDRLHELEQERAGAAARVSALARSLDQRDASGSMLDEAPRGLRGRVADHVRVDAGYEAAVGAALGQFADALLADSERDAQEAVAIAHREDLGRLGIVITESADGSTGSRTDASTDGPDVPGAVRIASVIKAPNGIVQLLARSYIAEDLTEARRASKVLRKHWPSGGYTVVTTAGDVLTEHTLSGGSSLAPSRIELIADREQAEQRHEALGAEIETLSAELAELHEKATRAKQETQEAYTELRAADARSAEVAKERNRLATRAEAAQAEAERARQALTAVAASEAEAVRELGQAESAFSEAEARPRPMLDASERDQLFVEVERARSIEVDYRLELETARERARAGEAQRVRLAEQFESEKQAAEEAARRAVLRTRQVNRTERVAEMLPAITDACDRSLAAARLVQQAAEQERAKHSQELTLLRAEESELRQRLQGLTERVHGAELKSYERKLQLSALLERSGNELGLVEEVLIAEYGPDQSIPVVDSDSEFVPFVRAEQEKRLARAEKGLAELGRINPLALEEFSALEQRHSFLSEQLADLKRTREDLLSIIGNLDEKMQGIFAEAFADTQEAFAEVFPRLFPGGSGDIQLSDPSDLLNTGIDMAVRPAGKNVERLSLLSGGERSLAAVAWLIAIFQARPSPFYIMDEVEAALDDANLGRLLQVFESLREHSQLIVITHQKRTMEITDALYGVSMRHDGISAVVGQRIGQEA
ncbi:MAG: chromosome segregation protein SMC [Leucobacter sp.]